MKGNEIRKYLITRLEEDEMFRKLGYANMELKKGHSEDRLIKLQGHLNGLGMAMMIIKEEK